MTSKPLLIGVLSALLVAGLALSLVSAWYSGDWLGFLLNLGTELVGAAVTYFWLDQYIEGPREREKEREAERQRIEDEKARLIAELGSSVHDVAVAAAERLQRRGWLKDDLLKGANLSGADLKGVMLVNANLRGAILWNANLRGASTLNVNLQGASLRNANLQEAELFEVNLSGADLKGVMLVNANLSGAQFDENTTLPDNTKWTPETNMSRFTDPDHPDHFNFRQPRLAR